MLFLGASHTEHAALALLPLVLALDGQWCLLQGQKQNKLNFVNFIASGTRAL